MELKRRNYVVFGLLVAAWVLVLIWQVADHNRVQNLAREELIHRAKDVSTTVGTTLRVMRRFGNIVSKERLEPALAELLRPGEWEGIALLNEAGEVVVTVGRPVDDELKISPRPAEIWGKDTVVLFNTVALGTNVTRDLEGPVIVLRNRSDTNRPPTIAQGFRTSETNAMSRTNETAMTGDRPREDDQDRRPGMGPGGGRRPMPRPPRLSDEEWKAMQEKQGVHTFAVVMSTKSLRETSNRDLWLRGI